MVQILPDVTPYPISTICVYIAADLIVVIYIEGSLMGRIEDKKKGGVSSSLSISVSAVSMLEREAGGESDVSCASQLIDISVKGGRCVRSADART